MFFFLFCHTHMFQIIHGILIAENNNWSKNKMQLQIQFGKKITKTTGIYYDFCF